MTDSSHAQISGAMKEATSILSLCYYHKLRGKHVRNVAPGLHCALDQKAIYGEN